MKSYCISNNITKKLTLSIFVFFSFIQLAHSQQLLIDSLLHKRKFYEENLKNYEIDTNYIKNLYTLARTYVYLDHDSTNTIAQRALGYSENIKFKKGIAGSKLALGVSKIFEGNFEEGFKDAEEAREIASLIRADTIHLKSLNAIGMGHFMKSDYAEGYKYCQLGREKAKKLNNHEMSVMFNMNLATSFAIVNDPEQALPYYEECLRLLEIKKDLGGLAQVKSNMGYMFIKTNEIQKAKKYLKESIEEFKKVQNTPWQAFAQINLGEVSLIEKELDSAIQQFKDSKKLLKNIYDPQRKAEACLGLSEAYLLKNDLVKSEQSALIGDSISKSIKFYDGIIRANNLLYRINKSQNNTDKAIAHLETSRSLSDSIEIAENKTKFLMLDAQINYENEQAKIANQNIKEIETQKIITYLAIILLISAAIILFLIRRNIQTQKRANSELLKINAAKDKVFSIVGHDLKTPISTLQELLELYKSEAITEEQIAEITPRLKNNVDHSAFTLNNLLLWAQNQMNGVSIVKPETINIKEKGKEIVALYQEQIQAKNITVECNCSESMTVFMDEEHLNIILRNITLNAIKYSIKGGKISFNSRDSTENQIIFSVCDNGVGMSKSFINQILNNHSSVSKPGTLNEKGTGLGLKICQDLLVANNGDLTIESTLGRGSCFEMKLPK